jgi:hypothetical protein
MLEEFAVSLAAQRPDHETLFTRKPIYNSSDGLSKDGAFIGHLRVQLRPFGKAEGVDSVRRPPWRLLDEVCHSLLPRLVGNGLTSVVA